MTTPRIITAIFVAWLLALLPALADAQATHPTSTLVTFGPGEELYERFGHNALRIENPDRRPPDNDALFNYGVFDFGESFLTDFLPGFVQGNMIYLVEANSTPVIFDIYREHDRTTILQELNFTPEQNQQLADFLWDNTRPEKRGYVYNYYNDNCSTRVRDAIDRVTGGQIKAQTQDLVPGHTYRFHTRRTLATNIPVLIGLEYVLGQNVDKPLTRWEEMFLPVPMHLHLRDVTMTQPDGQKVPLIRTENVLYQATRPDVPDAPPVLLPWFLAAGILMLLGLLALGLHPDRRSHRLLANLFIFGWTLLAAFAGCFASYLNLFTNHWAAYRNENLLQMPPFALVMLVMLPWALRTGAGRPRHLRALRITQYVAIAMAACSILGLALKALPWFIQDNWNIITWVLPVNVAIAIILWQRAPLAEKPAVGPERRGAKE